MERLILRGLQFSHAEWYFPPGFVSSKHKPHVAPTTGIEVGGFVQAAFGVPGAVWGVGLHECKMEHCRICSVGTYALELGRGCQSNRIARCEFSDLGAGGVKIGETQIPTTAANLTAENEITDCEIHDGGKVFPSAIGIWIGQSPSNRIAHNHVHDFLL